MRLGALIAALVLFSPRAGMAAPPKSAVDANVESARKLFELGVEKYKAKDFETAIRLWERSYALSERPLLFDNISRAHEGLERYEEAIEALEKWRAVAPEVEHEALDLRLERLRKLAAPPESPPPVPEPVPEPVAPPPPPQEEVVPVLWPGYAMLATGGAAAIGGVVMGVVASRSAPNTGDACKESAGKRLCSDAYRDDIERSDTLRIGTDVAWISGLVFAGAGVGWLLWKPWTRTEVITTGNTLSVRGRF